MPCHARLGQATTHLLIHERAASPGRALPLCFFDGAFAAGPVFLEDFVRQDDGIALSLRVSGTPGRLSTMVQLESELSPHAATAGSRSGICLDGIMMSAMVT